MAMNIFNNHIRLYLTAGLLFTFLTYLVVIMPAFQNQYNNLPLLGTKPLSGDAKAGKLLYIAEGCVGCHSQQVRNVDMDKKFGSRPGMAADYANIGRTSIWQNTATLMGTERTGPDLTDVGNRQPSKDWNLMHLYHPRSVVPQSIMPSYQWLFEIKAKPSKNDVVVTMPSEFLNGKIGKVVAKKQALQLVAYIQSLKQTPLPTGTVPREFLYKKVANTLAGKEGTKALDGKTLYDANCIACHQANGEGLKGAFPSLKGSPIVNGENLELYVDIIMNGYDARAEYGVMAAVGTNMNFTEKEVTAIINYERSSWGNKGKKVTEEEIKKVMDFVKVKVSASNQ
ncbi:cbb3-type cytochrome c oxidase subunit II [Flavobacterium sp.]|uniref:cbb3-type cytochrome c oxidase subunit II n=1 Tax=Flavobacterium sp. TaxID=239 RepID=UPI0025DD3753|nr:cbb3-type cytochrome c oxidase subunit II [Flavobacterium sp.]